MKKGFAALCLLLMCLFVPVVSVRADGGRIVQNYTQLMTYLNNGGDIASFEPDADFGWPTSKTQVVISRELPIDSNWVIPANITLVINSQNYGYDQAGTITLYGTILANEAFDYPLVIKNGGCFTVNKDFNTEHPEAVEAGGQVIANKWFVIGKKMTLEKGAKVTAGKQGKLVLCGATLESHDATVEAPVYINEGYSGKDEASYVDGTLTVSEIVGNPGNELVVKENGTLTITDQIGSWGPEGDKYFDITVRNAAKLIFPNSITLHDSTRIQVKGKGIIYSNTKLGRLGLDGSSRIALEKDAVLNINWMLFISEKATIIGSGTINLGTDGFYRDEVKGIASTVKIIGRNANNNGSQDKDEDDETIKVGDIIKDLSTAGTYKVTSITGKTVTYQAPALKKATMLIPATVKVEGVTYKVTAINAKAFYKNTKLKKLTISKNVKIIGKNAFYGCKKLKNIVINTTNLTTKTVGKNAFKGIYSKATVKVPKKKLAAYKKLLRTKGIGKNVKIKK